MLPFVGPFFYKCNDCGKIFNKSKKSPIESITALNILLKPKCPKCGSRNTKSIDYMIRK
ncbi:zinc ribbon domain-containing protein [Brachyspira pilosicoli]|uniref:zinc ribbon domain-containing protein n=1 Tax=Brachyspira pilosicoli TaxID=52584 RepID=UPI00300626A7